MAQWRADAKHLISRALRVVLEEERGCALQTFRAEVSGSGEPNASLVAVLRLALVPGGLASRWALGDPTWVWSVMGWRRWRHRCVTIWPTVAWLAGAWLADARPLSVVVAVTVLARALLIAVRTENALVARVGLARTTACRSVVTFAKLAGASLANLREEPFGALIAVGTIPHLAGALSLASPSTADARIACAVDTRARYTFLARVALGTFVADGSTEVSLAATVASARRSIVAPVLLECVGRIALAC